ncbi:MAG TPA: TonB-dependent receptor [Verrucomicrobiales bacterium]|nr:TonB-dependent receptor [Verrucomicrobiales bacterium]HIL70216.1 TonB-dependent receptor [Verrucomicrobiota bacterium]
MDRETYGTFAEIGAGQEVVRWFFRVGGASGTIAKTISAYDMTTSDAIYGKCERYVSRERLCKMLEYEYELLEQRLRAKRGPTTRFFAFADTVAASSYSRKRDGDGWLGIRFQHKPEAEPSEIIIHVRLLDLENLRQQEVLGQIGVGLVCGGLYQFSDPVNLVKSLLGELTRDRIEVDLIKFSGAAFTKVDNRLMSLELVTQGLADAALFMPEGEVIQPAELLYKKSILVNRGSFRPVTNVTIDMLRCGQATFVQEEGFSGDQTVTLMEMTLSNLSNKGTINPQDFLDRVDMLSTLGNPVLVSNYMRFFKLAAYLFRHTQKKIGLVMGVPTLKEIFLEKYYEDLEGGILESFGRLFKHDLKLYVYPLKDKTTNALITAGNLRVDTHLRHLYSYMTENCYIEGMRDIDENCLDIFSRKVLGKIRKDDSSWESEVPESVVHMIKERGLFKE